MITLICLVLIFIASYMLIKEYLVALKGSKIKLIKNYDDPSFAIIIPARDESLVISNLLDSIKRQSIKVNPKDIYIIVESKKDKTVEIAKTHNINIVYRRDLTKRRKGYAIDDRGNEQEDIDRQNDAVSEDHLRDDAIPPLFEPGAVIKRNCRRNQRQCHKQ